MLKKSIHHLSIFILGACCSISSYASLGQFSGTPTKVSGVDVYPVFTVSDTDLPPTNLGVTGAGVRKVTKLFLTFNVYVAASYFQDTSLTQASDSPMDAVKRQKTMALQLTMLRSLSASEVRSSFEDGLDANGIDMSEPAVKAVLDQIDTGMDAGQTSTLLGYQKGANQVLVIESPGKHIRGEGKNLAFDFWSIIFGEGDSNLKTLQLQLLGRH